MKIIKTLSLVLLIGISFSSYAQNENPIHWDFKVVKLKDQTYELHATATLEQGWHVYAQSQPKEAVAEPTTFTINKNPLLKWDGKFKEMGKKEKYENEEVGIKQFQYGGKVDFVQTVTMKAKVKTAISGTVTYQVCTDERCLTAKTIPFSVALE